MKIAELSAWVKLPLIVIATALAVVGVVWLEVEWLGQYGWSAFVGVPFGVGLITGSTHLIILGRPLRCGVATLQGWGVCIVAAGIMLVMGMERREPAAAGLASFRPDQNLCRRCDGFVGGAHPRHRSCVK